MRIAGCGLLVGRAVLAGTLVLGAGAGSARAEVIDRVLAVVGGELIMLSDVNAARDLGLVMPGPSEDPIREVLSRLAPQHRAALTLRYLDGLSVPEAATILDRSVAATETLLVRARRALRKTLDVLASER